MEKEKIVRFERNSKVVGAQRSLVSAQLFVSVVGCCFYSPASVAFVAYTAICISPLRLYQVSVPYVLLLLVLGDRGEVVVSQFHDANADCA